MSATGVKNASLVEPGRLAIERDKYQRFYCCYAGAIYGLIKACINNEALATSILESVFVELCCNNSSKTSTTGEVMRIAVWVLVKELSDILPKEEIRVRILKALQ